jgi:hypothetical protein
MAVRTIDKRAGVGADVPQLAPSNVQRIPALARRGMAVRDNDLFARNMRVNAEAAAAVEAFEKEIARGLHVPLAHAPRVTPRE